MDYNLIYRLRKAIEETENAGREIYYAMSFIDSNSPAMPCQNPPAIHNNKDIPI